MKNIPQIWIIVLLHLRCRSIQQQRDDWGAEMKSLPSLLSDRWVCVCVCVCVRLNLCAIVILLTMGRLPHIRLNQLLPPSTTHSCLVSVCVCVCWGLWGVTRACCCPSRLVLSTACMSSRRSVPWPAPIDWLGCPLAQRTRAAAAFVPHTH